MITTIKNVCLRSDLEALRMFTKTGYLTPLNFCKLDNLLLNIGIAFREGKISKEEINGITSNFDQALLENTLHGRGLRKPNGYPGDYLFLDGIYTSHISSDLKYRSWDRYTQQHAAPMAVRKRKEYYKKLVGARANLKSRLNVLNIVSGSGREIMELYDLSGPTQNIQTTCVELDEEAIYFSRKLNKKYLDRITYIHSNIFKYRNSKKFDFIWSAGLFDYLDDSTFIVLLKKFRQWGCGSGEIVIGNYNEHCNPSREYMEILGDWFLIHRTEAQLIDLARKAGFKEDCIKVNRLEDNIILYLHLQCH